MLRTESLYRDQGTQHGVRSYSNMLQPGEEKIIVERLAQLLRTDSV